MDGYEVLNIPIKEIFLDWEFNCRGKVYPGDVIELAQSIYKTGLQQPVVLQEYNLKPPFKYRCVAGHRRCVAFQINKTEFIPAFVRNFPIDLDAHKFNLKENLERVDLNILQEANALKPYILAHWTEKEICEEFEKSTGWVRIRKALITLPPEIQQEAVAGLISQDHILRISKLKTHQEMFELVKKIKDAKFDIEAKQDLLTTKPKRHIKPFDRKHRSPSEIYTLNERLISVIGPFLGTRLLAWAAGAISDTELEIDIQSYCEENGYTYERPEPLLALMGV